MSALYDTALYDRSTLVSKQNNLKPKSCRLNRTITCISSSKLEFLALKWAATEQFRNYLYYDPHFTVYTDNPLTYVLTSVKLNATGHRWVAELSDFNFTIKYRPGKLIKMLTHCLGCQYVLHSS